MLDDSLSLFLSLSNIVTLKLKLINNLKPKSSLEDAQEKLWGNRIVAKIFKICIRIHVKGKGEEKGFNGRSEVLNTKIAATRLFYGRYISAY